MSSDGREPSSDRIELRLTICCGDREADFAITAGASDTIGDVQRVVLEQLGAHAGGELFCERRGISLSGAHPLHGAGIRWGDRLVVTPRRREPTRMGEPAMAELAIVGGPCAGAHWMLALGRHEIGRDAAADVRIDDPSLSRRHGVLLVSHSEVTITDVGSSNGISIDGEQLAVDAPWRLTAGDTVELGRSLLTIRPTGDGHQTDSHVPEHGGLIHFNREPRVANPRNPIRLKLAAPPESARLGRLPLVASAVPILVGVVMFVVLHSPIMLMIAALSPIMAVTNYVLDRRRGAKSFSGGAARFRAEAERAVSDLDSALLREAGERRTASPDVGDLIERARSHESNLWERRPRDDDFMKLRVGVADMPAFAQLSLADGGDPKLRAPVELKIAARGTVPAVPVTVDLIEAGTLGLAGPRQTTARAAASLVIQAACLHSPADLVIAAAVAAGDEWRWLKWLPHLAHDRLGLRRSIAIGRAETTAMLTDVRDVIADRRSQRTGQSSPPALLLLLDEDVCADRALVTSALAGSSESRVTVVWLGQRPRDLPGHTGVTLVAHDTRFAASLTNVETGERVPDVALDGLEPALAAAAARALCPTRDVSERAGSGDIPQRISLLELLDLSPVTHSGLIDRWSAWAGELSCTVGAGVDGPVTLDLRADGPHALIAGTTGSGKSELLRTFVVAAAAAVPPHRLNFMLVDYKGGSAFAPCAQLPHVVEVVSDLDEHLAERALVSLRAELKRRELVLAENGARDLLELQRRAPDAAPPILVIAVDEFAKLREEVPEFVDGVVDIAQRGRSLGVHMVLAAQTLRNAFTPAIRANTNLRIALRVAEDSESADVISSSAAALIPSGERYRGRAFARTGHAALQEFQTAYISGQTVAVTDREVQVLLLGPNGPELPVSTGTSFDSDEHSDLAALARIAVEAADQIGLPRQHAPWLDALPAELDPCMVPAGGLGPGQAAIGLIDRPHLQRQDPLLIDLPQAGHVIVFGAGGSGKSSVLVTTAFALAAGSSPAQLRIYGLDGTRGSLTAVDRLPHCGGVVAMDDEERVDRLLRQLLADIDSPSERRTVLLLDDLGSFQTIHEKPGGGTSWANLQAVLSGGRAAGVHVICTASRRGALSAAMAAHIGQRLALRMPTDDDLVGLGLESKKVRGAKLPPGRGFTQASEEFQVARRDQAPAIQAADGFDRVNARAATRISTLPATVPRADLGRSVSRARLLVGISDATLSPAAIDLRDGHFVVVGPYHSGRSTALATIALAIREAAPDVELLLLSPRRSPLRDLDLWKAVAAGVEACGQAVDGLLKRAESSDAVGRPAVVLIDDAAELSEPIVSGRLERILKAGRDGALTVVAAVETSGARGIVAPWIREARREGHGLLLQPDLLGDGDLLNAKLPRRVAAPLIRGRGFVVYRGVLDLVHIAS